MSTFKERLRKAISSVFDDMSAMSTEEIKKKKRLSTILLKDIRTAITGTPGSRLVE